MTKKINQISPQINTYRIPKKGPHLIINRHSKYELSKSCQAYKFISFFIILFQKITQVT